MTQAGIRQHRCPSSSDTGAWQCRQPMDLLPAGVQHGRKLPGNGISSQPLEAQRWVTDQCHTGQGVCQGGWALPLHRDVSGY